MDGWNTIVSSWYGLFSGAMLVLILGSVYTYIYINDHFRVISSSKYHQTFCFQNHLSFKQNPV